MATMSDDTRSSSLLGTVDDASNSSPYYAAYHLEEEQFLVFHESAELEVQRSLERVWFDMMFDRDAAAKRGFDHQPKDSTF
jgi:hypothetical protein